MRIDSLIRCFLFFLLLLCSHNVLSQESISKKTNQFNHRGQKDGFWVDTSEYWIREKYYKDGILSGVYKEYNSQGKLLIFGEYKGGRMCGTWYYFDKKGFLLMTFRDFSKNAFTIIRVY